MTGKSLLHEIESLIKTKGMGAATFGRAALGDPNFVSDLRKGRRLWPTTEQKVRAFIARAKVST